LNTPGKVIFGQDEFHCCFKRAGKNGDPKTELNGNGWFHQCNLQDLGERRWHWAYKSIHFKLGGKNK